MNPASPSGRSDRRLPELLAPAGSHEKLVTAVRYGADAVYLGGRDFSLRARAANFDAAGLRRAVDHAHDHGVKAYVTVNIFAHNRDFEELAPYLEELRDGGADGLVFYRRLAAMAWSRFSAQRVATCPAFTISGTVP